MDLPRPEYPRPQFERAEWLNLNGPWRFEFDDAEVGLRRRWFDAPDFSRQIQVPFAFQSPLSGIHQRDFHDVVWYQRSFDLPPNWAGKRILLHFGAVDYHAWVWVNGIFVTYHEGGHTPFQADVAGFLNSGGNSLVVRVEDRSTDREQPRGKQYWEVESSGIFYTRTTGIWQTVWLEPVHDVYLAGLRVVPDIDASRVHVEYQLGGSGSSGLQIETEIGFEGLALVRQTHPVGTQTFTLDAPRLWSPESPALYDLRIRLTVDGSVVDEVRSYFGMRKISVENGRILLNNQPCYMRLVLDQGYHPQGILTFPSDDDIRRDVELTKVMGFNGARKHQKVEDPRYLYWADRLGLLVWGEMANCYEYSERAVRRVIQEWQEAVRRDYNHPCVVAWVPVNESWGVPALRSDPRQTHHLLTLYHLTKSLDPTRPVVSNDGWEHAQSDLCTIHDYSAEGSTLRERYAARDGALSYRPDKRPIFVSGFENTGQPVLVSEFGGIAYRKGDDEGWGYSTAADDAGFIRRFRDLVRALQESPLVQGYCYTQLTDVEQEINGLLTYDRQPKVDLEIIRQINLAVGL